MVEIRSRDKIIVVNKKTGEWEMNYTKHPLDKDYMGKDVCIYHAWETIKGTMQEVEALKKTYPMIWAETIQII